MPELVDFLRSSIPSFVVLDSKYREAIPEIIQALPLGSLSDDEGNTVPLLNNKRKSRAKRIGKDGLYPWEDRSVAKWWRTRELDVHDGVSNEHREEEAKRLIKDLRTRETQLQLILVLEVLALEATLGATVAPHQPSGQAVEKPDEHTVKAKKRRPKRGQDLDLHLELLVDRLSIWQSVSLPDGSSRPSTSTGASKDRKSDRIGSKGAISTRGDEEDRLRDFCTEVIVPL